MNRRSLIAALTALSARPARAEPLAADYAALRDRLKVLTG